MFIISSLRQKYYPHFQNTLDFDLLLASALRRPKDFLYSHTEYSPTPTELKRFQKYIRLYQAGYSVAAIIQHKEFYGLDFFVNKNVLIPRPDTDLLVEEVIKKIKEKGQPTPPCAPPSEGGLPIPPLRGARGMFANSPLAGGLTEGVGRTILIDVGTGSGCIPISILKNTNQKITQTFALDISSQALAVAKKKRSNT